MAESQMLEVAVKAADSKRAEDIVALGLEGISFIADEYLIMQAPTERQVLAIADEIADQMEKAEFELTRQEGRREGQWVLLDYGDLIVHIFKSDVRHFYNLEKLWGDAPEIDIADWIDEESF